MKTKEPSIVKSICYGLVVAFTVSLLGFGVMWILYSRWLQTDAHLYPGLKGLFDYKASSLGDLFCLPMIVGAGFALISYFKNCVKNKKWLWIPALCGLLGGFGGAVMQAQWIKSDTTILNWSIPVQHQFNAAGWYHACFFVFICFAVAFIAGYMLVIDCYLAPGKDAASLLEKAPIASFYSICQFAIWFFGLLFLHFHYIDDYSNQYKEWMIIGKIAALGSIGIFCCKLVIVNIVNISGFFRRVFERKEIKREMIKEKKRLVYFSAAFFAIVLSAEVALIDAWGWPQCNQLFLICGLFCTATYVHNSKNKLKMLGLFLSFVLLECLCQEKITEYLAQENRILFFAALGICLVVPICVSLIDITCIEKIGTVQRKPIYYVPRFLLFALLMNLSPLLQSHNQLDFIQRLTSGIETALQTVALKPSLVSLFLFILLNAYIRTTFPLISNAEYYSSDNAKQIDNLKYSQYIVYSCAYVAAIVLLWNSLSLKTDILFLDWRHVFLIVAVFLCYLFIKPSKVKKSAVALYLAYAAIIIYLLITRETIPVTPPDNLLWGNTLMTIYTSCNMAVIMALSIIYNVFLLRHKKVTTDNIGIIIVIGLLSSLCFGLAAYQLFLYQTVYHAIQLTIITLISFCVLPHKYSSVLNPGGNVGIIEKQTAKQGVIQDGFLFGIVANANTIITMAILGYLFKDPIPSWRDAMITSGAYAVGLFPLCHFCLENNIQHKNELRKVLEKKVETEDINGVLTEQYNNLEAWLSAQHRLAILLSLPYSLCYYVIKWIRVFFFTFRKK